MQILEVLPLVPETAQNPVQTVVTGPQHGLLWQLPAVPDSHYKHMK